ncbi:cyclophilin-like fold protein [Rathayibacter tanaceti]|uniref:Cyclophilin-like domain-containing protein n=2 Tax=Rathayibacter tanaceti TaxID=1671680 RepID=A0A162GHD2_9MICO|nr:cyclophilin-like fold protein [Rathayibacter tanaceti]KZX21169.1 hypothetical protein ACH61_01716 [Rathayibacter tanaceti]QHC54250.1 hypothetical protein GSU10_00315 [Rathayibacter tanaceti]TCO37927.1 hypothetical protein EV639_103114 [Rathayibacter tanaceti]
MLNRRHVLPALVAVLALTGCATAERAVTSGSTPTAAPPSPSSTVPSLSDLANGDVVPDTDGTPLTLTVGDRVVTARLNDTPAARALAEQLPLTLAFDDLNAVEKTAPLASPPSMAGMPSGDDPEVGDIGLWAPSGDLVLYYGDVGYWDGIARLGTFDDVEAIASLTGPFTGTLALG